MRETLTDLAVVVGVSTLDSAGLPTIPDNAYELNRLKAAYNEGLRLMAMSKAQGWYCLRQIIDITIGTDTHAANVIDGDISRYRLPLGVSGQPFDEWSWVLPSGTLQGVLQSVSWGEVTRLNNVVRGGSLPAKVAMQPMTDHAPDGTDVVVWTIQVHPRPNQTYTLTAHFVVTVPRQNELDSRHPFGSMHDSTVLAAAKWAWVKDDTTEARWQAWQGDFTGLLQQSKEIDDQAAPTRTANLMDGTGESVTYRFLPTSMTINGTTI